ncbi:two-component sensor histidine kinase [Leptospira sp. 201903075]|uniref:sensor histidine kinase n=1 Tax=Leptospira chreensis TaxID=2810035 RepID=UPI00196350C1|nr:ATP-binding protein [Leptospira chreensis]MBM9592855.1 two-component sensor histidine kinase [Leptospira chreensis]
MITSVTLLKEFTVQMKSQGLRILISIRMVIGWIAFIATMLNFGKPTFLVAGVLSFYFLLTSLFGYLYVKKKESFDSGNGLFTFFLSFDFLAIVAGFYLAIHSYPKEFAAIPIQNSVFFTIFFFYQLYIAFYLNRRFSTLMGILVILSYIGGLGIAIAKGTAVFTQYRLEAQTPGKIVLTIEILKIILLMAITYCLVRLVSFLLDILENNNQRLAEEINLRETTLLKNDRLVTLGTLASNVAHEINNPLAGIKAMNEYLFSEEFTFLKRKEPLWKEKETEFLFIERNRKQKRDDYDVIYTLFHFLPKEELDFLAERCIDLGIDHKSFEGLALELNAEWEFVFLWLKYKTMEKANLLISNGINRTEKIISTFQQISEPYLDRLNEKVRVGENIRDVLLLYNQFFSEGLILKTEIDDSLESKVSESAMKLVWTHLILNAIQAAKPGKGIVHVKVTKFSEEEIQVSVTDNGKGIPDDQKESIFMPFFTTRDKGEGSGLGLPISKDIVEKQKGRLEFQSVPGNTVFSVYLPLAK